MTRKIIYTRPDGGLSVVHPVEGGRLANFITLADGTILPKAPVITPLPVDRILRRWPVEGAVVSWAETEDEFVSRIALKDVPSDALAQRICDESEIPVDRHFRDAWEDNGVIEVNMTKAREIKRDSLRALRVPLFVVNDLALRDAHIAGNAVALAAAIARRDALRAVTEDRAIETAATPEALKAVLPRVLQ